MSEVRIQLSKLAEQASQSGESGLAQELCTLAKRFPAFHGHLYRVDTGEIEIWVQSRTPPQALQAAYTWLSSADYEDFEVSNMDHLKAPLRVRDANTGEVVDVFESRLRNPANSVLCVGKSQEC